MPGGTTWFFWLALILIAGVVLFAISRTTRRSGSETDHYSRALNQLIREDWDGALASLRRAIASGFTSPDAYLKLGSLLHRRGDHMAAFQIHQNLTVRTDLTDEQRINILHCLIQDYQALGRNQDALQTLQELAKRDKNPEVHKEIARVALASGEYAQGIAAMREAQKADPSLTANEIANYLATIGARCLERNRKDDGKRYLQQALKEEGNCEQALLLMGDLSYQDGDHDSALYYWQKQAFAAPQQGPDLHERLEKVYFDLGRFGDIERVYTQILEKRPNDKQTLLASARIAMKKGEAEEAERMLRLVRELDPKSETAFQMLADLLLERGKIEETRQLIAAHVQRPQENTSTRTHRVTSRGEVG